MAKIYIVMKSALNQHGTATKCTTERAFSKQEEATAFLKSNPVVWEEQSEGMIWYCERGIHETELE